MMLIDTDVLAIYHIFLNDKRYEVTASFISQTKEKNRSTSIYNLLELFGIISTAGKAKEADTLLDIYLKAGDINILYPDISPLSSEEFWADYVGELRNIILRGVRYGDAKIIWVAESNECSQIITWNKRHYIGKTNIDVMNPREYLEK